MNWREKELLTAIKKGKLTTSEVVGKVNMSKVTALKYLEGLRVKNLVDYEEIGTAKIWFLKAEDTRKVMKIEKTKLLIVDDDRNVITIIRDSFDSMQFDILEAVNGKEALGVVFAESPDMIILDIMMPDMDGYKVCQELKKHESTKNIPIIILSAKTGIEDKLMAMGLGVDDYVVKPFDPRELKARVKLRLKSANDNLPLIKNFLMR
jgi:PleD family two-component response regulator